MAERSGEDPDVLHRGAQIAILSGLAGGNEDAFELMLSIRPYDLRGHFTPDVALLEVAAAALGLACPPGSERLRYEGLTDRYLADYILDGRTCAAGRSTPSTRQPACAEVSRAGSDGGSHSPEG